MIEPAAGARGHHAPLTRDRRQQKLSREQRTELSRLRREAPLRTLDDEDEREEVEAIGLDSMRAEGTAS